MEKETFATSVKTGTYVKLAAHHGRGAARPSWTPHRPRPTWPRSKVGRRSCRHDQRIAILDHALALHKKVYIQPKHRKPFRSAPNTTSTAWVSSHLRDPEAQSRQSSHQAGPRGVQACQGRGAALDRDPGANIQQSAIAIAHKFWFIQRRWRELT